MIVRINPKLLRTKSGYTKDKQGNLDLIGLIAQQISDKPLPVPLRVLSQFGVPIYPLTTVYRNQVILTPTGYYLTFLDGLPVTQQINEAKKLLTPFDIEIVIDEQQTTRPNKPQSLTPSYKPVSEHKRLRVHQTRPARPYRSE